MSDAVTVAVIVAVPTTLAPIMLRWADSRARRAEKEQDWNRQDEVAANVAAAAEHAAEVAEQASRAADLLAAAQEETIKQADEVARLQAISSAGLGVKLDEIHAFVNSDMTAQKKANLILMLEIASLHKEAGHKTSKGAMEAIREIKEEIAEREHQQAITDANRAQS
jgi:hypothetical protein